MQPLRPAQAFSDRATRYGVWVVIGTCLWGYGSSARGQSFHYASKPRASSSGMSYASADPAPRMMEPNEEIGRPLPRRRYVDPRYRGRGAEMTEMAARRFASRQPQSRLRIRSSQAEMQAPPADAVGDPFVEVMPSDAPLADSSDVPLIDPAVDEGIIIPPRREEVFRYETYPGGPPSDMTYFEGEMPLGPWDNQEVGCGGCGNCDQCGYYNRLLPSVCGWWNNFGRSPGWRNFNTFSGAQGFKAPPDLGMNGNFGFNKGVNWAFPFLPQRAIGMQLGGTVAFSDFNGSTGLVDRSRTQLFATGGWFHRARCNQGLQGGAVVDYLYDDWYVTMNMLQVRGEVSYLWGFHEIGVWAAAHLNSDTQTAPPSVPVTTVTWQTTDQYNLYYRANFSYGAVGRMWIGLSGHGDVLFGADATAPLSERWAIQIAQNYLMPRDTSKVGGSITETWGLTLAMVWYPWAKTPNHRFDPYRPLFNVVDNSYMFVRMK